MYGSSVPSRPPALKSGSATFRLPVCAMQPSTTTSLRWLRMSMRANSIRSTVAGSASTTCTPTDSRRRRMALRRKSREPMPSARSRTRTPRPAARTNASATRSPVPSSSQM